MTTRDDFDRLVSLWLDEEAGAADPGYLAETLARVDETDQRRWRAVLPHLAAPRAPAPWAGSGVRLVAILALLAVALSAAVLVAGALVRELGPRAGRIAYVSDGDIYVANVDGSNPTLLVGAREQEGQPAWSPDGTKLAFFRTGHSGISRSLWVARPDGTAYEVAHAVMTESAGAYVPIPQTPAWSPDSRYLVFARHVSAPEAHRRAELVVADSERPDVQRIELDVAHVDAVSWSPTGDVIAAIGVVEFPPSHSIYDEYTEYAEPRVLLVMDPHGRNVRPVNEQVVNGQFMPVWSRDGLSVAYVAGMSSLGPQAIHVATRVGDQWTERRLSVPPPGGPVNDLAPAWSSDGRRIAFLRQPKVTSASPAIHAGAAAYRSAAQLRVVDADGANERVLLAQPVAAVRPCWTPDDRWIAAARPGESYSVNGFVLVSTTGDGVVRDIPANEGTSVTAGCSWQPVP